MIALTAFLAAYAGFTALLLAMDRHHRAMMTGTLTPGRRLALRAAGLLALAVSLLVSLAMEGGTGVVQWFGLLAAAATMLAMIATYQPGLAPPVGLAALSVAAILVTAGGWL